MMHLRLKKCQKHTQSEWKHFLTMNDLVVLVKESLRSKVLRIFPSFWVHVNAVAVRYDLNKNLCYLWTYIMLQNNS